MRSLPRPLLLVYSLLRLSLPRRVVGRWGPRRHGAGGTGVRDRGNGRIAVALRCRVCAYMHSTSGITLLAMRGMHRLDTERHMWYANTCTTMHALRCMYKSSLVVCVALRYIVYVSAT